MFVIFKKNIEMYVFVEAYILINMCYKRLRIKKTDWTFTLLHVTHLKINKLSQKVQLIFLFNYKQMEETQKMHFYAIILINVL